MNRPSDVRSFDSLQHKTAGSPDGTPSLRPRVVLVRDRDRVYGDCLPKPPHSPVSGGHLHASDKRCAPNMCRCKERVSIGAELSVGVGALSVGGYRR